MCLKRYRGFESLSLRHNVFQRCSGKSNPRRKTTENITDWLGTKRRQTTANGNEEERCLSNPFGDGLSCTGGPDASEQHFTGKDRDVESTLDYFGARYYSSTLGRFMTPDWAGKPTAVPYANFGDPQSLNLYAYVRNNPNTGIDADGHFDSWAYDTNGVSGGWILGAPDPPSASPQESSSQGSSSGSSSGNNTAPPKPPGDNGSAQQKIPWSPLSGAQQALVSGGEKGWDTMSADAQDNFDAITNALAQIKLSKGATGLSEVQSASMKSNGREMNVTWKSGAADAFKKTRQFSETYILPTHPGAQSYVKELVN